MSETAMFSVFVASLRVPNIIGGLLVLLTASCLNSAQAMAQHAGHGSQTAHASNGGPTGIRAGSMRLYPSISQALGYSDNINQSHMRPESGGISDTEFALRGSSAWRRHDLRFDLRAGYQTPLESQGGHDLTMTAIGANIDARVDMDRHRAILVELDAQQMKHHGDESRSAGAAVTLIQRLGRYRFELRGEVDRYEYDQDGASHHDTLVNRESADYDQLRLSLRGQYMVTARTGVFAEIFANRHVDRRSNAASTDDGSRGIGGLVGVTLRGRRIDGEASIGYHKQKPEDSSLDDINALLIAGTVDWQVMRLTQLRFTASTRIGETTLAGSGGIVTRNLGVALTHNVTQRLQLLVGADYSDSQFEGTDEQEREWWGRAGLSYSLNNYMTLFGNYSHHDYDSSAMHASYKSNILRFGVRLER